MSRFFGFCKAHCLRHHLTTQHQYSDSRVPAGTLAWRYTHAAMAKHNVSFLGFLTSTQCLRHKGKIFRSASLHSRICRQCRVPNPPTLLGGGLLIDSEWIIWFSPDLCLQYFSKENSGQFRAIPSSLSPLSAPRKFFLIVYQFFINLRPDFNRNQQTCNYLTIITI